MIMFLCLPICCNLWGKKQTTEQLNEIFRLLYYLYNHPSNLLLHFIRISAYPFLSLDHLSVPEPFPTIMGVFPHNTTLSHTSINPTLTLSYWQYEVLTES